MFEKVLSFLDRYESFVLTTHDPPDADGLGTELVLAAILKNKGKKCRIINASPMPLYNRFMDKASIIEIWDDEKHANFAKESALMVVDTSDEYHLGSMRENLKKAKEIFIIDHHEINPKSKLTGFSDPTAASTSELAIEIAECLGVSLDCDTAAAAYAGIVYDTGFFAYTKTTIRTFKAAIKTLEWGADPNSTYRQLMENGSLASILLQKQALSKLEFYADKKIAVMVLCKEDFENSGAAYEDSDSIVNIPLKAQEVEISMLIKEKPSGEVRCSLRSKGNVNVSKIAQVFNGGGHISAAGLKSPLNPKETLKKLLNYIEDRQYISVKKTEGENQ